MNHTFVGLLCVLSLSGTSSHAAEWIHTDQPLWGLRDGLQFAIHPAGFGGRGGGPRGLLRLGAPVLPGGGHTLVNFIAVEPIVKGRRAFSELEWSRLDSTRGIRFWAEEPAYSSPADGVEQLEVPVTVEPFANGAQIRLILRQRSDAPDELRLAVHAQPGSAAVDACILTATMGNLVRARRLWLKGEILSSLELYPDLRGSGFAPHTVRPLESLCCTAAGEAIVAITGDEQEPSAVFPFPGARWWHYGGAPVVQYWKCPKEEVQPDLRVAVNARYTYWQTQQPIPGGAAFENFELRARFREGQSFIFGITRRPIEELGLGGGNTNSGG